MGYIRDNVLQILSEIPVNVKVLAAAKSRTASEIKEALDAGITMVGENYLQESVEVITQLGSQSSWHFIGHIQKNKVKNIVPLFDMIETVDSVELAVLIDKHAQKIGKIMPVLIEVNSARESQKAGVMPEEVQGLVEKINTLPHIKIQGLMTMGPFLEDPSGLRPYYRETKKLFDEIKNLHIPKVDMKYLSMGMSDSYPMAIEEGATMIRIGTKIFGPRT